MKAFSSLYLMLWGCGLIGPGFLAMPVFAQNAEEVQELQRVIDAQQRQLEAQQKQLDAQMQLLQDLQKQMESLGKDVSTAGEVTASEKPSTEPVPDAVQAPQVQSSLSYLSLYDGDHPMNVNVIPVRSEMSIPVPGTNTQLGVHGIAQFQMIHDTNGINANEFDVFLIPAGGAPSQTKFSVNPSHFAISSNTTTSTGRMNTFFALDFNGELNTAVPRLRLFFGEFIKEDWGLAILAGQAFGTMLDLRSVPETTDFAGPSGYFARRHPILRITKSLAEGVIAEVAIETPEDAGYRNAATLTRWPDLVVAGNWLARGKYLNSLRVAGLLRDLRAEGTNGSTDSALGWTVNGSGSLILPWFSDKDNFKFGVQYGYGYGFSIKSGPADAVFDLDTSELRTLGVFSTYGGLQHWWTDLFRSSLVFGYVNVDNPAFIDGEAMENNIYLAGNFVRNINKDLTVGLEYLWGQRENKDGSSGANHRVVFTSRFDF